MMLLAGATTAGAIIYAKEIHNQGNVSQNSTPETTPYPTSSPTFFNTQSPTSISTGSPTAQSTGSPTDYQTNTPTPHPTAPNGPQDERCLDDESTFCCDPVDNRWTCG